MIRNSKDIQRLTMEKADDQIQPEAAGKNRCGDIPTERCMVGDGYEVFGRTHPARITGEDFYDIFLLDKERICVVVGDISGKDASEAPFMVKAAIKENLNAGMGIADTFNLVNRKLCILDPGNMSAAVFCLTLNTKTGKVQFANAGLASPLLLKEGSPCSDICTRQGGVLGLSADEEFAEEEITLNDGEGIFLFAVRITDAIHPDQEQSVRERLRETVSVEQLKGARSLDTGTLVREAIRSVHSSGRNPEQSDDITCAAVRYKKKEAVPTGRARFESFMVIRRMILASLGESENSQYMILACEEIFSNIINYSGADEVYFCCDINTDNYSVTFFDNGVPFDPVKAVIPKKEFEELDKGGMGIKLARLFSSEMIYNRRNNQNILQLIFLITQD